ncbi:unnamed protein product [Clavelina lepadiformis]|uniref:Uncharacterized protein n=1 Tax=Clavelina lepadiformis TaxID=159417 RepID=A0ABP0FSK8_CLALP
MGCAASSDAHGNQQKIIKVHVTSAPLVTTQSHQFVPPPPPPAPVPNLGKVVLKPPRNYRGTPRAGKDFEGVLITEETVGEFQALNVAIADFENKNVVARLETLTKQHASLQKEIKDLSDQHQILDGKTKKEHQDVTNMMAIVESSSVFKYFSSQYDFDQQLTKEEEEYVQARTEQENCYQELIKAQTQHAKLSAEINSLENEKVELIKLYEKQDKILEDIFGGLYGSALEDELENKFDNMQQRHQRIRVALERWRHCEALVKAATSQLEFGCRRWFDIQRIPRSGKHQMVRIQAISEARNYIVAASRNLTTAQRYLLPVTIPYCGASEVATLNRAINFIFIDGMSRERHNHALQVYQISHARSIMLQKWVANVIGTKIAVDLADVRNKTRECKQALRAERIRLIKIKFEEDTGKTIDLKESQIEATSESDEAVVITDVAEVDEVEGGQNLDEQIQQAKADNTEGEDGVVAVAVMDVTKSEEAKKTPMDELAPAPSQNELFGNLDSIMASYTEQNQRLAYEQETDRARQEAQVKERLRRRRSQKIRLEAQQAIQAEDVL